MIDILLKNKNILIIVIYAYILFNYIDEEDYVNMLALTFMTGLLICNNKNVEGIENNPKVEDIPIVNNIPDKIVPVVPGITKEPSKPPQTSPKPQELKKRDESNEKIVSSNVIKNTVHNMDPMGPYDGLCISGLEKNNNLELLTSDEVHTYFGTQGPDKHVLSGSAINKEGPHLDGLEKSEQKLAMLSNNKVSIGCCSESPYSTSNGCVCLTENQKNFIRNRGSSPS
tara:strand:- start:1282 stop:1962 length:681 start_codon:yes stop_codon:yes gene_type:complete